MNFPTQWDSNNLAVKDYRKSEKIRLFQYEQNLIQDLKLILKPFVEITELLKGNSHCTYSLMNPVLLEIKNRFRSESTINSVKINFENEESSFGKDNRRIQINEPVDCTSLINKIKLTLSAAIDYYWKDLS